VIRNFRFQISEDSYEDGAGAGAFAGGVLAQGFGPGAVAVAVFDLAQETEFAAGGKFFFQGAEVGAKVVVLRDAQAAILEIAAQCEGEFFLQRIGEIDGLDFPAEVFAGTFGEVGAESGLVNAGAFELRESEDGEEVGFDFGEWLVVEFEAQAVVHDAVDLFAEVDDAEVAVAGDVEAEVEGIFDF
jgi:hypothetical protein